MLTVPFDISIFVRYGRFLRLVTRGSSPEFLVFPRAVKSRFGPHYLYRDPIISKLREITDLYAEGGWPGCMRCIDCCHHIWKQCPKDWNGQYQNPKERKLAVINAKAWCDSNLYGWYGFNGRPGIKNGLTVLENSPRCLDIVRGRRQVQLTEGFSLSGTLRNWMLYFLVDGIYPEWAMFSRPSHTATTKKGSHYSKMQESERKAVERLFIALQGRFKMLQK